MATTVPSPFGISLTKFTKPSKPVRSIASGGSQSAPRGARPLHGKSISGSSLNSHHFRNNGAMSSTGSYTRAFASEEGIPAELLEDSKFVPISGDDPRFGPPALVLLGFDNREAFRVQGLLKEMEGDFMEVLLCTEEMARGTLGQAVSVEQPNLSEVRVVKGLPRIIFISGLTGEEIMLLIEIFPEAGLEDTVFAAHVPNNSDKSMKDLIAEVMDDHERLRQKQESAELVNE